MASVLPHALPHPLEHAVCAATQSPGPTNPNNKISAPERFIGMKEDAANLFMLDCNTCFVTNGSSFPTKDIKIMCPLMKIEDEAGNSREVGAVLTTSTNSSLATRTSY
ncbi:Retrotransposon-derived protein PEG10 [Ceratobasidium sp. AG-Ba]|nr:Retrotransposon-derived protein PEG10 [Ceratobasidium sp. AG-Ba]QRV96668.1 Retrotransposon-derived protein PEG10 [Ceratobasidium sp. AG-Ba]